MPKETVLKTAYGIHQRHSNPSPFLFAAGLVPGAKAAVQPCFNIHQVMTQKSLMVLREF
jgi:hypothetical protein